MKSNIERQNEQAFDEWPTDGLERVEQCPVCGSKARHQLYSGLVDRVFRCAPGHWDVYQCEGCRSAYLDPRPTPATIHLAYQHYYTHEQSQRQSTEALPSWRRFVRSLANGYRNRRYGGQLQPASRLGQWIMPLFPRLRHSLDCELRYLPPLEPGARLLDVGFGSGEFMALAQRVGWRISGVDLDPVSVANARKVGLDVRPGGIEAFDDALGQFDVITLNHVIEHVHDPIDTLKRAYELLKPLGQLYIETPNINARGHRQFREHWRGIEIPRHLVMFNRTSIMNLLYEIGFSEVRPIFRHSIYASLASASRAIENNIDPYAGRSIKLTDFMNELRFDLSSFFNKESSEFITLYAKK